MTSIINLKKVIYDLMDNNKHHKVSKAMLDNHLKDA